MFALYNNSVSPVAVIGFASLAWFVVGVVAGRTLLPAQSGSKSPRRGGSKRGDGSASRDRSPRRESIKGNPELYVGNLSYDVTEKDLTRKLGEFGRVSTVRVITNSFNGKSKGYAFVQMADRGSSDKVIKATNGKEYEGRKMVVNIAKNDAR
ncbi:MAG: hypothetical protein HQ523_00980 [Lentisphaerae bacterium]|nr:hypothetical protein [Lentisphaerota bacterium]